MPSPLGESGFRTLTRLRRSVCQHGRHSQPGCIPIKPAIGTTYSLTTAVVPGWGHRLQRDGHRVTSIGKLHYIDSKAPTGFDEQIIPMHLVAGGDVFGLERENPPKRPQSGTLAAETVVGHSGYTRYDEKSLN